MITDEALRAAAEEAGLALAKEIETIGAEQPPYVPGAAFRKNLRRLRRRERYPTAYKTMQRVAAVFFALLLAVGGWLTVDAEARGAVTAWVQTITQGRISYRFLNPDTQKTLPACTVTWLPEGFVEADRYQDDQRLSIYYTDSDSEDSFIVEIGLYHSGVSLNFIGDHSGYEEVFINEIPALFIPANASSSISNLVWLDEGRGMYFCVDGTVEKAVILHIAEGIKLS